MKFRCDCGSVVEDANDASNVSAHIDHCAVYQAALRGAPRSHLADAVNNPEHYMSHPSQVACIQVTEHMSFCLGNVIKYVWRADLKGGTQDLEKAKWYLSREIERRKLADQRRAMVQGEVER